MFGIPCPLPRISRWPQSGIPHSLLLSFRGQLLCKVLFVGIIRVADVVYHRSRNFHHTKITFCSWWWLRARAFSLNLPRPLMSLNIFPFSSPWLQPLVHFNSRSRRPDVILFIINNSPRLPGSLSSGPGPQGPPGETRPAPRVNRPRRRAPSAHARARTLTHSCFCARFFLHKME